MVLFLCSIIKVYCHIAMPGLAPSTNIQCQSSDSTALKIVIKCTSMKSTTKRNISLGLLTAIILLFALWWWQGSSNQNNQQTTQAKTDIVTPQEIINNTAHKAKEKAVNLTMEVASSSITDINTERIKVASKVIIKNPLPVALNASRLDYTVFISATKIAEGSYTKPIHVPASSSKTFSLPMQVLIKPMAKVIDKMDATGKDMATYTFKNVIHTDIPIAGERKFEVNMNEELPVVRLPKLKPGDLDVKKFGLKNSGIDMTMQITNPNPFPIRMKDARYSMKIDGKHTVEGAMQEVVSLPAKATVPVAMHMDMKTGRALKMGWKMLFDKKDTRYELTFDSKILSDVKMLANSNMHFTEEGTLYDLKEALKTAKK